MIIIIIPAKGGSARLPNKNMALVAGRPMLDYTIDAALASRRADRIYVSTDDDVIAVHAASRGIAVIRRPTSLGGETPITDVYRHAVSQMPESAQVRVVIGLQPDHPDRTVSVDEALKAFEQSGADRLGSSNGNGTKNGAHYILSDHFLRTGDSRKDTLIVDDCTNIHYDADLKQAAERLAARLALKS